MRKSFDGLCSLTQQLLGQDALSGNLFIFINRRRDRIDQALAAGIRIRRRVGICSGPARANLLGARAAAMFRNGRV